MAQRSDLGLIRTIAQDTAGNTQVNATVAIRWRGATVLVADAGGASPRVITVGHRHGLLVSDTVELVRSGVLETAATFNVSAIAATTVTLTGATVPSLAIADRITVKTRASGQPTIYKDDNGTNAATNPMTTDATGRASTWIQAGFYDRVITSGAVVTFDADVYATRSILIFPTDSPYNAVFDNSTDDYASIAAALADAALTSSGIGVGAIVVLPEGSCTLSARLNVKHGVVLRGQGPRSTFLTARAGFSFNGTTDSLVRIGDGTGIVFNARLERVGLDLKNIAGSIGVYSTEMNEGSGLFDFLIVNFKTKGIFLSTSGAQNWEIRHGETYHTSTTAIGIDCSSNAYGNVIDDMTINSNDATTSTNPGIRLASTIVCMTRLHFEYHAIGVEIGTNSQAQINTISGGVGVTDLIKNNSTGCQAFNIAQAGATYAINDTVNGTGQIILADGGYYITGNDGSGATGKDVWTSSNTATSRKAGPVHFLSTLRAGGAATLDAGLTIDGTLRTKNRTTVASASALNATATTGNYWSITGTTPITSITTSAADNGRLLFLTFGTGAASMLVDGSNLLLKGTFSPTAGDSILLIGDGTNWEEITRSQTIYRTGAETIASASTVTVAGTTVHLNLTGTTTLTKIASAAAHEGTFLAVRNAHGSGSIILTNGVVGTANDMIMTSRANVTLSGTLVDQVGFFCDGINWFQIASF